MNRHRKWAIRISVSLAVLISNCGQSGASLVSIDDAVFGVGAITLDTSTGFEWLDVPLSIDRSYADVSAQFGVGGDFAGFRYATRGEVEHLFFSSAGITPGTTSPIEQAVVDL